MYDLTASYLLDRFLLSASPPIAVGPRGYLNPAKGIPTLILSLRSRNDQAVPVAREVRFCRPPRDVDARERYAIRCLRYRLHGDDCKPSTVGGDHYLPLRLRDFGPFFSTGP